jgi:protease-4
MFASMAGFILAGILLILILFGIIGAAISGFGSKDDKALAIKPNTVLEFKLSSTITDRTLKGNNFNFNSFDGEASSSIGVRSFIHALEKAAKDENIKGISLLVDGFPGMGRANSKEVRDALLEFKKSGKFIYAYGEIYTQGAYYLASVADKVTMFPSGMFIFNGFGTESQFYKKMFEKAGIEVKLIRVGKYKSAGEPFIRENFSEENKEQIRAFLGSLSTLYFNEVGVARKISADSLSTIADNLSINLPEDGVKFGLLDQLVYPDQYLKMMMDQVKVEKEKDFKKVDFIKYANSLSKEDKNDEGDKDNQIAIVYAVGEIGSGEGSDQAIGSKRIAEAIKKARENEKVKAIVLRVNSPGGSALASDVILRELELAKKEKPLIVSMGDLAASGGYLIACKADSIFAQPNTITGSIGVFGLIPNAAKLMSEKLGITTDYVNINRNSSLGSIAKPLTMEEEAFIQNSVNRVYTDFLSLVSSGRKIDSATVAMLAEGRVYSGTEALNLKLVDRLADFETAIKSAAKMAKLDKYSIREYPKTIDPFEQFTKAFQTEMSAMFNFTQTPQEKEVRTILKQLSERDQIQARLEQAYIFK